MDEAWGINLDDFDAVVKHLEQVDANINPIADEVTMAMAEVLQPALAQEMPKSETPKAKTKRELWRSGRHAGDDVEIVRAKTSQSGRSRYRIVGFKTAKNEDAHWYMRLVRFGTSKMEPNDFIARTLSRRGKAAVNAGLAVLKQEIEK